MYQIQLNVKTLHPTTLVRHLYMRMILGVVSREGVGLFLPQKVIVDDESLPVHYRLH